MILISENKNIMHHLATEEYLLRHFDLKEDILYIWPGSRAFVFGRNQNPYIEIQPKYLNDSSILNLRRVSGGGTIFQDEGTINFSIITKDYKNKINDYQYFLNPLISLLNSYGLNAYFKPKSHLFVDDYKISGNAQAFINNRLMHHGTILFDTDLGIINDALINYHRDASGHQVLSNKQSVINLKSYLKMTQSELIEKLAKQITKELNISHTPLSHIDESKINQLVEGKYKTWDWNYAKTPEFQISIIFEDKEIQVGVKNGLIEYVKDKKCKKLLGEKIDNYI
jgi:lipoate-protein ligase A